MNHVIATAVCVHWVTILNFQLVTFGSRWITALQEMHQARVQIKLQQLQLIYAQYTPPTPTRRNCFVASAWAVWTEFATISWRLPTDSVDNLETDQTDSIAFDYTNFNRYWRHYVVIDEKFINIYQNSRSQPAMESVWSVSKLSTESVGSRHEIVANSVHTADVDATKQFRRVGVGGVYWALREPAEPAWPKSAKKSGGKNRSSCSYRK